MQKSSSSQKNSFNTVFKLPEKPGYSSFSWRKKSKDSRKKRKINTIYCDIVDIHENAENKDGNIFNDTSYNFNNEEQTYDHKKQAEKSNKKDISNTDLPLKTSESNMNKYLKYSEIVSDKKINFKNINNFVKINSLLNWNDEYLIPEKKNKVYLCFTDPCKIADLNDDWLIKRKKR